MTMMRNYRVTGPVDVPPATAAAMLTPMISHRSEEFRALYADLMIRLRPLFGTRGTVVALGCSGTGGMEAAVGSVLRAGERVLVVEIGHFGERFAQIAQHHGLEVDVLSAPWGSVVPAEDLRAKLSAAPYDAVFLTHSETSTGVLSPLRAWAEAIRAESDCLIIADVVSSLGATEIDLDGLGLDVAVGVTQKALACPPGLALVALSDRALHHARRPDTNAYYLDLAAAADHAQQGTTTYTPPVSILYALDAALAAIETEGLDHVWRRHQATALRCREAVRAQGLTVLPDEENCSPTVTALSLPGAAAASIRSLLAERFDTWVSSGRGDWKDTVLRIGHMGPVDPLDVEACAAAIGACVREHAAARDNAEPTVTVLDRADDLGEDWDRLAADLDAPIFHTRAFLQAYEHNPVQNISEPRYLEVRATSGALLAAVPTYLQGDPLGLLGLAEGEQALLSPMWHAPDSRLLTRDERALDAVVAAFGARAEELSVAQWGFVNLTADLPIVKALERRGFERRQLVPRWALTRQAAPDGEAYLGGMRKSVQRDYARQLRRYHESASAHVHGADYPELLRLLELIAASAARTGSPKYYRPEPFARFLREMGPAVRLVEIRSNAGETLAVAVCFLERDRLQAWAGGYVRGRPDLAFSPYYALWWEICGLMWSGSVQRIECGRLNETFKEKMLLTAQPLVALMGPDPRRTPEH